MRMLLTSDWHVDAVTAGFRRAGDVESAALRTVVAAKNHAVDAWAFLGDLADPDSGPPTLRALETAILVAERLNQYGIPNWWVAGNHDVVDDGSGATVLRPLQRANFRNTTVFERPAAFMFGTARFYVLPFAARSHAYDPAGTVAGWRHEVPDVFDEFSRVHVFLGHLQLEGARLGSETVDMPRGRDVAFPVNAVKAFADRRCFNGHYHARQRVGEVVVPGSLQRLSFGEEANDPGYLVVDF